MLTDMAERTAALEHRVRSDRRWLLGLGLSILAALSIAAQTAPSAPTVVRATRLEVVDAAGHVVFTVSASEKGGRLEVLNHEGQETFSAGIRQDTGLPGLWERQLRTFEQQQRAFDQQRQTLTQVGHQLYALEQQSRRGGEADLPRREIEQQRRDLDQQRRDLDQQRRQLDALERQLRSLERR